MELLCSFLRRRFSRKQVVAWQNVGCFLRLLDRRLLNWPSFRPQNTPNLSEQDQKASLQRHWTGTTDHAPVGRSGHGWSCSNVPPLLYPCERRLQSTGTSNWDPAEDLTKENTIKKTNRRHTDPRPAKGKGKWKKIGKGNKWEKKGKITTKGEINSGSITRQRDGYTTVPQNRTLPFPLPPPLRKKTKHKAPKLEGNLFKALEILPKDAIRNLLKTG